MSKNIFSPCNILIPQNVSLEKWSVIACDQFTSNLDYWEKVEDLVGKDKSSLRLVLPEVYLQEDNSDRISAIHSTMKNYLMDDVFELCGHAFVYVERTLKNGDIRPGIVGIVDLEEYDYTAGTNASIRPTEKTVIERIPPRKIVRNKAVLEMPHAILFYSDEQDRIVRYIQGIKALCQ